MTTRVRGVRASAALALVVGLAIALAGCAGVGRAVVDFPEQVDSGFSSATRDQLDAALTDALALSGSPGGIAGVWAPWAGTWVSAAGTTEPGGSQPMTTDMHFRIADNTKPMTCDVLFALADNGTVSLDDLVEDRLSGVVGISGITLGQLCQSSSGIGDSTGPLASRFAQNPLREWTPMELISDGIARRTGAPGDAFVDSDAGYVLAGLVAQAVTHESMQTLYDRYVFQPLGLRSTSFPGPADVALPEPAATGWQALPGPDGALMCDAPADESRLSNSMVYTAGGVVSTVDDLQRYAQALASGALRGERTKDAAWQTIPLGGDAEAWQSYAQIGAYQLGPMRGQYGSVPGQMAAMLADPESGLTVVVMLNSSTAGAAFIQHLAMKLAAIGSKAPPADGRELPAQGLPWSVEQMNEQLAARAVCQPPAPQAG